MKMGVASRWKIVCMQIGVEPKYQYESMDTKNQPITFVSLIKDAINNSFLLFFSYLNQSQLCYFIF